MEHPEAGKANNTVKAEKYTLLSNGESAETGADVQEEPTKPKSEAAAAVSGKISQVMPITDSNTEHEPERVETATQPTKSSSWVKPRTFFGWFGKSQSKEQTKSTSRRLASHRDRTIVSKHATLKRAEKTKGEEVVEIEDLPPQERLYYYCESEGAIEDVEHLVTQYGVNLTIPNEEDDYLLARYPIHHACGAGAVEMASYLIDHGASLDVKDTRGLTPLHYACHTWHNVEKDTIAANSKQSGWKRAPTGGKDVTKDVECRNSLVALVRLLVEKGADVNASDNGGQTSLHLVSADGNVSAIEALIDGKAHVNKTDEVNRTPLHLATWAGHNAAVRLLLEHKADHKIRNKVGRTALHVAAVYGRTDIAETLVDHGADVNARNNTGATPLHICLRDRFEACSRLLIEKGTDLSLQTDEGETPLAICVDSFPDLAVELLDARRAFRQSELYGDQVVASYDFTDLDNRSRNFKSLTRQTSAENVNAVLTESGPEPSVLRRIVHTGHRQLISHPVVVSMLEEKWLSFARNEFYKEGALFVFYLALWTIATSAFSSDIQSYDLSLAESKAKLTLQLLHCALTIRYMLTTIQSISHMKRGSSLGLTKQVLKTWRGIDFVTWLLVLVQGLVRLIGATSDGDNDALINADRNIMAIITCILWTRSLRYLAVLRVTGPLVRMIFRMSFAILNFSLVYVIFLVGFAHAFFITYRASTTTVEYETMGDSIVTLFRLMAGDFDYTEIRESELWMPVVLYVVYVVLASFLLLNLLIAMMNESYKEVHDDAEKEWRLSWARQVLRAEDDLSDRQKRDYLEDRQLVFETAESVGKDASEELGLLESIQQHVEAGREDVKARVDTLEASIESRIREEMDRQRDTLIASIIPAIEARLTGISTATKNDATVVKPPLTKGSVSSMSVQELEALGGPYFCLGEMKHPDIGVPLRSVLIKGNNVDNCFFGREAITWMQAYYRLPKRASAHRLLQTLFRNKDIVLAGVETSGGRLLDNDTLYAFREQS